MAQFRPYAERRRREDAMIVHLTDAPIAATRDLGRDRLLDCDADGLPVRVRFTRMSGGMDPRGVPDWEQIERLIAETFLGDPDVRASLGDGETMAALDEAMDAIARGEPGVSFREVLAEEARRQAGRHV